MPIIECRELTKAYGKHVALNPLSRTLEDVYVQTTQAADGITSAMTGGSRGRGGRL